MIAVLSRIGAIAGKELLHIRRDPRILISVLVMPVVQLVLFAYAISFDVKDVPTVILDRDHSVQSRAYLDAYRSADFFDVLGEVDDVAAIDRVFESGRAGIAVIVPPGFGRALDREEEAEVAVLVDGGEPNSAQLGHAYAVALNEVYGRRVLATWADREGLDLTRFGQLEPRIRTWYNPERRSADFLIPGLMVVIVMIVTIQQTAVTLVRERDIGTDEQMRVSPMRRWELMVGKLLPWTVLALVDIAAITGLALVGFGVPLRGSVPLLGVSSFAFVFCCLALGLIISALSPSPESANITALLIAFLPGFMLSGFTFPLESVPAVLRGISYVFPGRYMVTITRGVFLKGAGFSELWPQLLSLAVYAVIALTISSLVFGRRQR